MKHRLLTGAVAAVVGIVTLTIGLPEAEAQEVQITGPLAGAPAVRKLRLHRKERHEVAISATLTLLDEYRRSVLPGLRYTYHFYDWFGIGLAAGYSPPIAGEAGNAGYNTALTDELQEKAVNLRNCTDNPYSLACRRSEVSLCRGSEDCMAETQIAQLRWMVVPQATFVPFRGKLSLFYEAFVDADVNLFVGVAIVGLDERAECAKGECPTSFALEHRVTAGPSFGLGLNFYPLDWLGFGGDIRLTPWEWNTSGFDVAGEDSDQPDGVIDGNDRAWAMNPMVSAYLSFQLPPEIEISD